MGGRGGGGAAFHGVDARAQRALNAQAPNVPHLGRRVAQLFRPYVGRLILTVVLVIVGAAVAVIPPLIVQRVFDDALFPIAGGGPDLGLLVRLVLLMVLLFLASAGLGLGQTWLTSTVGNSVTGDLRVRPASSSPGCRTMSGPSRACSRTP
jgi:ATP-binding cassette subfamily B protein